MRVFRRDWTVRIVANSQCLGCANQEKACPGSPALLDKVSQIYGTFTAVERFDNNRMVRGLLALGAFMVRFKVWDWSMGSLGVAWYARLHPQGAGASAGGPKGPGSASIVNIQ